MYAINADKTPTPEAWKVGKRIAKQMIDNNLEKKGTYPKKVVFTLWGGEFIRQQGIQIATIFHLLGVEPVTNSRGKVHAVRLITSEELGRPRTDVFIQTSGQFRDIAASRMTLIDQAVRLAKDAGGNEKYTNYVYLNSIEAEKKLIEKGMSPEKARTFSTARLFGGVNGNYGTGIMGMVEAGDQWEDRSEIAEQYIKNMGAVYTDEHWGEYQEGLFEASASGADTIAHGRSSNTWGPLSLDHVYEFMGGASAAIEHITGEEPEAMFTDLRNRYNPDVQYADEAIWTEARSTVLNPSYIKGLQKGSASSAEQFAETFRNTYAWNSLRPSAIDNELWDGYYDVYIDDKLDLDMQKYFEDKNPYALQEMTAVMLESARKGLWKATDEQIKTLSDRHTELVQKHEAGCSGFVCNNSSLKDFIAQNVSTENAEQYRKKIDEAVTGKPSDDQKDSMELEKEVTELEQLKEMVKNNIETLSTLIVVILIFGFSVYFGTKKSR